MKICYFGAYSKKDPRNSIIIKGLRKNGVDVVEGHEDPSQSLFKKNLKLVKKHFKLDYDAMIVGFPGHTDIPLARLLTKLSRKPLIFDAFLSLYDSYVFDRKKVKEDSLKVKYYFYVDKFTCMVSDVILLDTNEHINYFHEEFSINKEKFKRIFIGADDEIFYPRKVERNEEIFTVEFHGTFIPLQGIQYIIKAAKILENYKDIKFELIGSGQTYNEVVNLSRQLNTRNISFKGCVDYKEIPYYIAKADVGLGIFGDTAKAKRVIPNKVYEVLAMRKPLITGDSPAAREVLINKENCILCEMANPKEIANSILLLKEDESLKKKISKKGYELFKEKFSTRVIGKEVKKILKRIILQ